MKAENRTGASRVERRHLAFVAGIATRGLGLTALPPLAADRGHGGHREPAGWRGLELTLLRPTGSRVERLVERVGARVFRLRLACGLNWVERMSATFVRHLQPPGGMTVEKGLTRVTSDRLMLRSREIHLATSPAAAAIRSESEAIPTPSAVVVARAPVLEPLDSVARHRHERSAGRARSEVPPLARVLVTRGPRARGAAAGREEPALPRGSRSPVEIEPAPGSRSVEHDWGGAEVNRLTDKVMAAIDRRIVTHRERMGRS